MSIIRVYSSTTGQYRNMAVTANVLKSNKGETGVKNLNAISESRFIRFT